MSLGGVLVPLVIEPMREEDIPQILEIEREAFALAWSEGAYRRELRWNRLARYLVLKGKVNASPPTVAAAPQREKRLGSRIFSFLRRVPAVAPANGLVLGYAGQWLMVDEAHLITIAVRREYRRLGMGESLLIVAIEEAIRQGARVMTLEVRVSNIQAQNMYEKFGFRRVGLRPRYYTDNNEDALLLASDVLTSPSFQSRFQELKAESREKVGVQWSL